MQNSIEVVAKISKGLGGDINAFQTLLTTASAPTCIELLECSQSPCL